MFRLFAAVIVVMILVPPASGAEQFNLLKFEASPYLQLHSKDPVKWRPWNKKYLGEARSQKKPIFLSIGYLACHWCHVMRRESFSDAAVAARINEDFFPILIDREELPAVDDYFQTAMAALNLPSGWPLNVVLTPAAQPIWGGAYFPLEPGGGSPGFLRILADVASGYAKLKDDIQRDAESLAEMIRSSEATPIGALSLAHFKKAAAAFLSEIDGFEGGFGGAPKFPMVPAMELLWRGYVATGKVEYREAVTAAVAQMTEKGMYDHVGGGFYRYVVDSAWLTPHFEKMLDVNAGMLRLMIRLWREEPTPGLGARIRATIRFLFDEMALAGGGFAAALDADSESAQGHEEEGAYYVWNAKDITARLGGQAPLFLAAYGIGAREGEYIDDASDQGVLHRSEESLADLAGQFKMTEAQVSASLAAGLKTLKAATAQRPRPRRDGKILADWNAMVIEALAEIGAGFGDAALIRRAGAEFQFVSALLTGPTGALSHSYAGGKPGPEATLSDYAGLARAGIALYEATGRKPYLERAAALVRQAAKTHLDVEGGGFYSVSAGSVSAMIPRRKPYIDNPNASGNGAMLAVLARLYYLTGGAEWSGHAKGIIAALGGHGLEAAFGVAGLLNGFYDWQTAMQVVIIGARGEAGTDRLAGTVMQASLPARIFQIIPPGTALPDTHPAKFKTQLDGKPTAYVCRGPICSLPVVETPDLQVVLSRMRQVR
ncbi:MAG: thioredoxin domain-containing protein [Rhodospirillaceae bacterium]|nr:thioredoxin domain-containing protein [Rhodospirillaceae bacterium]MBT7571533.1 thioredoxin domain-containing protein [Rhodospirillaceae bacterium]